ncbi:MAG: hypothetical protein RIR31_1343 [Bacteroidota bacterium]|jgi:hypothetical protein
MNWKKHGLLYCHKNHNGDNAHTTVPFVKHLQNDVFRIYFSPRDEQSRSCPIFIDINIFTKEVVNIAHHPLLLPGSLGTFDDAGCVLFQILEANDKRYLYYSGWTLLKRVPFTFFIGLAIAENNKEDFTKFSQAPVIGVSEYNPFLAGAPWIIIENDVWRMWYVTGLGWKDGKHIYTVTYAESTNGIDWRPSGKICLPFKSDKEYAIARPVVIKSNELYVMWYSYRATEGCSTYQIGYAESLDGIEWNRKDEEAGISASVNGWDSEMVCYPFVFEHKSRLYMIYNGNAYGKTGIGLAELI